MTDKLIDYKNVETSLPERNIVWPLYGAGLENLGLNDGPIEVAMPKNGPDELLVRHDACGLCFSDIKVIGLGEEHPRIYRNMKENPVVLGHEIIMTVIDVGENLRDEYKVGDRFTIQADIYVGGIGYAYGYEIQGGLSKYGVIDQRVLNGDDGNYLLPVQPTTGYAESALTEPWACVIAAYQLKYRTQLKPKGIAWFIGMGDGDNRPYTISSGLDSMGHPAQVLLSNVPANFAAELKSKAAELGVPVTEVDDLSKPPVEQVDDIIILGANPDAVEAASPFLTEFGTVAIVADEPMPRNVDVDMGRIHYNRWVYVGGTSPDVAQAYGQTPVRSTLKPGGKTWFVGAGGPIGRMHVQRAIQIADGPTTIVCSDVSDLRLNDLRESYADEAAEKGIEFICLNPMEKEAYAAAMAPFKESGFDDIIVLAPVPPVIADAATYLASKGVMNVFAGVARGTKVNLNLSDVYLKDARSIGHSASSIDDLRLMLSQAESGELSTNRSVAAVGSLTAAKEGLRAVKEASYPGKVVIFPNIKEFPLTAVPDLKESLPSVYAKLHNGKEWTKEAEEEFLRQLLP